MSQVTKAVAFGQPVAVICAGNTCRSPIIAALLRQAFAGDPSVSILSAGYLSSAKDANRAAPEWTVLQDETGVDLRSHRSRHISSLHKGVGVYVALEEEAVDALLKEDVPADRIVLAKISNPFAVADDPPGARLDAYRKCLGDAQEAVAELLAA